MVSATIRDIAIIVIAVQSIVIGVLIAVLVWQIWRLVKLIQTEIRPIVDDVQASVNTVRGTTSFVSDHVVEPVVKSNRSVARWRRTMQALLSDLRRGEITPRPDPDLKP